MAGGFEWGASRDMSNGRTDNSQEYTGPIETTSGAGAIIHFRRKLEPLPAAVLVFSVIAAIAIMGRAKK